MITTQEDRSTIQGEYLRYKNMDNSDMGNDWYMADIPFTELNRDQWLQAYQDRMPETSSIMKYPDEESELAHVEYIQVNRIECQCVLCASTVQHVPTMTKALETLVHYDMSRCPIPLYDCICLINAYNMGDIDILPTCVMRMKNEIVLTHANTFTSNLHKIVYTNKFWTTRKGQTFSIPRAYLNVLQGHCSNYSVIKDHEVAILIQLESDLYSISTKRLNTYNLMNDVDKEFSMISMCVYVSNYCFNHTDYYLNTELMMCMNPMRSHIRISTQIIVNVGIYENHTDRTPELLFHYDSQRMTYRVDQDYAITEHEWAGDHTVLDLRSDNYKPIVVIDDEIYNFIEDDEIKDIAEQLLLENPLAPVYAEVLSMNHCEILDHHDYYICDQGEQIMQRTHSHVCAVYGCGKIYSHSHQIKEFKYQRSYMMAVPGSVVCDECNMRLRDFIKYIHMRKGRFSILNFTRYLGFLQMLFENEMLKGPLVRLRMMYPMSAGKTIDFLLPVVDIEYGVISSARQTWAFKIGIGD